MGKRANRLRRPLTEQEVFQEVMRKAAWYYLYPGFQEARKDFWKRAIFAAFLGGPFAGVLGIMGLIGLGLARFIPVILIINALCCFSFPLGFELYSRKYKEIPSAQQSHWKDYVSFWNYIFLGWIGLFSSTMTLLYGVSIFLWKGYTGWEMFPLGYIGTGIMLWWKRMVFLRAIAEPETHPWFRPIRLFFRISIGIGILFSAITRIVLNILERAISPAFSDMILTALVLSFSLFLLGLAQMAWILAFLYYQKWRGREELKV